MNFNNPEGQNGSPKFMQTGNLYRQSSEHPMNRKREQNHFRSLKENLGVNSPTKNFDQYLISTPKPHRYIKSIPSLIAEPNRKAKKAEFGRLLKSSQFLTESRDTSKKAEKKQKSVTCSDMADTINNVDSSSFNFLIDSLVQNNKKNFEEKIDEEKSEENFEIEDDYYFEERKTIGKSDSLTAMQILNKKYDLGLENLEKISDQELTEEDYSETVGSGSDRRVEMGFEGNQTGLVEVVHPQLKVNFGQKGSNDEVNFRSISMRGVKKDKKKDRYSPEKNENFGGNSGQKTNFSDRNKHQSTSSSHKNQPCKISENPLKTKIEFSKSKSNPTVLMDSFGFVYNNEKENEIPNSQSQNFEKDSIISEKNQEEEKKILFQTEKGKNIFIPCDKSYQSKSHSKTSNNQWPFAYQKKEPKCKSYAISSTIRSDAGGSIYQPSTNGRKSYIKHDEIEDTVSQNFEPRMARVNSNTLSNPVKTAQISESPIKKFNYSRTQKREFKPYYSSLKTRAFNYNTISSKTFKKKNFSEKISIDMNKKLRYVGESKNSLYHGQGKIMTYNGEIIYEGGFHNGLYQGKGKLVNYLRKNKYADQDISTDFVRKYMSLSNPNFRKDVRGCRGITSLNFQEDGWESYDGFFRFGKMEGNGYLVLSDGRKYEGQFKEGVASGYGVLDAFGKKVPGVWKDNVIVQYL